MTNGSEPLDIFPLPRGRRRRQAPSTFSFGTPRGPTPSRQPPRSAGQGTRESAARNALALDAREHDDIRRRADDAPLRAKIREIASERRRFGYRRIHLMLKRRGEIMNLKKLRRLYREERLQVKRRGGRKRALGNITPMEFADTFRLADMAP